MRKKHTDSFPQPAATISDVRPSTVPMLGSAPASNSRLTTVSWPTYEAYMSGVHPPGVKTASESKRKKGEGESKRMREEESTGTKGRAKVEERKISARKDN